jgi:tetratricopeptide (TPR) repeat protein
MRAYIYVLRRDYPAARMDYNRLLELDPQSYSGRLGLATLEQKEGKFREALEILNKMLAGTPEDATLYIARADVEREMKHEDLALVDLEEAIRLDAASADAYLLRGNIYLAQKKKGLAKADFEKAISLGVPPADLHEQLRQCK